MLLMILFSFQNSQHETSVNIQIVNPNTKNEWKGKVVGSKIKKSASSQKRQVVKPKSVQGIKPNWIQKVYQQNHIYDHAVIRRIDNLKVFYITAVASNTSKVARWDKVVINGWENVWRDNKENHKYYCCLETNGRLEMSEVSKKNYWGYRVPGAIAAAQFICSMPDTGTFYRVALTRTPVCTIQGLKYVDIEYAFMQPDHTIGICAKVAYGELPADRTLEWFEINREMGADHIVLFTYNLTQQTRAVVDYYAQTEYVKRKDFDFPMKRKFCFQFATRFTSNI